MLNVWYYKAIDLLPSSTAETIRDNVKGMSTQTGDFPEETSFHGQLGGGLYGYAYPLPLEQLEIYTDDTAIKAGKTGTLLKYKGKNSSFRNPFVAADISTPVDGDLICELDDAAGEELVDWIKRNHRELHEA